MACKNQTSEQTQRHTFLMQNSACADTHKSLHGSFCDCRADGPMKAQIPLLLTQQHQGSKPSRATLSFML